MSEKTHWKKLRNNDYLGSWAFDPGQVVTATIKSVKKERVAGADGKSEDCSVAYFVEPTIKPLILNVTNQKAITKLVGSPYIEDWAGKRIAMSVKKVKAFGEVVDAVRVESYVPPEPGAKCAECGGEIAAASGMTAKQVEARTRTKYGRSLCADCATKIAAAQAEKEDSTNEPERPENASDSDA